MATKHILTCECGKEHPVETFQAGQTLLCECGKTLKIPSMLHIKKLPLLEESAPVEPVAERVSSETASSAAEPKKNKSSKVWAKTNPLVSSLLALSETRLGIFIVGVALFLLFGFLLVRTASRFPVPTQVFQKQRDFIQDGSIVHRDSIPVSPDDFAFYIDDQSEPGKWLLINDYYIDERMGPYMLCDYFNRLKNGPRLSDNFYENYDILKANYWMKVTLYGVLLVFSAVLCFLPWVLPKKQVTVGVMRGAEWKV